MGIKPHALFFVKEVYGMKNIPIWNGQGRPPREAVVFVEDLPKLDALRGKCTADEYAEKLGRGTNVLEAEYAMLMGFSMFSREDYI